MAAENSSTKITDIDIAEAIVANEGVDCFCGKEQKKSVQPKKLVSCTGGVFWGKAGERWPMNPDGEPLIPWLQIVCTEMKGLYGPFYQKKAVCFYLNAEVGYEAIAAEDEADLVVREYLISDRLVPLKRPKTLTGHLFHRVIWKKEKDYPGMGKYSELFADDISDAVGFENKTGIKIGGWPTPLQSNQRYPGEWDLQIDMTENFMYGDSGIGYLSAGRKGWYVMFECC